MRFLALLLIWVGSLEALGFLTFVFWEVLNKADLPSNLFQRILSLILLAVVPFAMGIFLHRVSRTEQ